MVCSSSELPLRRKTTISAPPAGRWAKRCRGWRGSNVGGGGPGRGIGDGHEYQSASVWQILMQLNQQEQTQQGRGQLFWKRLQVALFILTLATGAAWYSLWEHYVQTRPRIMQSAVGRVIPLHSHGLVVYLTKDEQDWLTLIYFTGSVLALSVVVIHIFKTPFKR